MYVLIINKDKYRPSAYISENEENLIRKVMDYEMIDEDLASLEEVKAALDKDGFEGRFLLLECENLDEFY